MTLEAYDTKKQVMFKFDGIEDISKMANPADAANGVLQPPGGMKLIGMEDMNADPRVIALPADAIKTTEKEFARLREAMQKDPTAFLQAAMAGSGNRAFTNGSGPQMNGKIQLGPQPVVNNPIELPEKK